MLIAPFALNASPIFKNKFLNIQGGIHLHEINKTEYTDGYKLDNKRLLTIKRNNKFYLIYGIPYKTPIGPVNLNITSLISKKGIKFTIKEKVFHRQDISVSKKYTEPSKKDLQRIIKEKDIISEYRTAWSSKDPDINFIYPVEGTITGIFGTQRYYNGKKGRYHNGIDIAGPINEPIVAPSSGKVLLTGDYFYNGKFVYIDHGKGLLSIFIHLNEINTTQGKFIKKGDVIGKIGTSGRSTGPHVHWSVMLNQNYIDPMIFLTVNKND